MYLGLYFKEDNTMDEFEKYYELLPCGISVIGPAAFDESESHRK